MYPPAPLGTCSVPLGTRPFVLGPSLFIGALPCSGCRGTSVSPLTPTDYTPLPRWDSFACSGGQSGDPLLHMNPGVLIVGTGGGDFGLTAQPPVWDEMVPASGAVPSGEVDGELSSSFGL